VDLDTRGDDADEEALAESQAKAAEALSAGRYAAACAHFTACVDAGPPSALMLARRAECLVRLSKPVAALRDCDAALALNPDNGKVSLGRVCERLAFEGENIHSVSHGTASAIVPTF